MTVSRETPPLKTSGFFSLFRERTVDNLALNPDQFCLSGLTLPFLSLFLLSLKKRAFGVVVFNNPLLAESFYRFSYNLTDRALYFPETQVSTADVPGFNLENERYQSEVFSRIANQSPGLITTTLKGLATGVNNPSNLTEKELTLSIGKEIERSKLLHLLTDWGYEQTDKTTTPKTFSVRGGIIDVFLLYDQSPVRIELFGNRIDSLRIFNPMSQRMIREIRRLQLLPPPNMKEDKKTVPFENVLPEGTSLFYVKETDGRYTVATNPTFDSPQPIDCHDWRFSSLSHDRKDQIISTVLRRCGEPLFLFVDNTVSRKRLQSLVPPQTTFVHGLLERGFYSSSLRLCCLSAAEFLKQTAVMRHRWTLESFAHQPQRSLSTIDSLNWGDFLVHQDFGIGVYKGLETIQSKDNKQECIKIEYADGGVIYVPVEKFSKVHKLISTGEGTPKLSSLGSTKWERQKQRVRESARKIVGELINLYSIRKRERGFRYDPNDELYEALVDSFPYEETPDQTQSIDAVIRDMERDRPMERLICGDVGFGKTEVAFRAIIKAVASGKKVLFLTPTTILADQHFISASARLVPLGVRVELLSRFKTKKEQKKILEAMINGQVDLVIGTHRLLSDDVRFPDLGLLIIDEEHRFGVRHKERLKQLKTKVDVITLTATPIPRTLQQSLLGIRDISRIDTPPKTRKPIQTFVKFFDWSLIKQVLQNELSRGGQVYFLHNDINALPFFFEKLSGFFPNHSVAFAHGKMNSRDLERIVLSFFNGKLDILLCTTIIESGLDVPNANTIIINNAQQFGLAQLYQIRGRVGRGYRQAFCYLLLPPGKTLGEDAYRRLKAIEQYTSLSSGYDIAMKDLEIRGAGNLFGYKQSGHIGAVGFEMYCKLLRDAVNEATGKAATAREPVKVIIDDVALFEHTYMPLVQDRLYFYQRLSEIENLDEFLDVRNEIRDRFGPFPRAAENLLKAAYFRILLKNSSVTSLRFNSDRLVIVFNGFSPFSSFADLVAAVSRALQSQRFIFRFISDTDKALKMSVRSESLQNAYEAAEIIGRLFSGAITP
ncbi:MAG: transcription-repair coupling factor [FCB group bacterium]|nr:transcription-repair coupling factor [FCB group bacterium]